MSKLALPPIGAIQDRAVQQALQAIQSWARHVDEQYLTLSDINTPNGRGTQQLVRTVNNIVVEATVRQAKTAAEVDRKNREAAAQVVRNVLQNSGTEPPVEIKAPQLFRAGTSTTNVYIGAGGIGGANGGVVTFGLDASDGSFFFGKTTLPSKQITFDATSGTLTFGSDIVVNTTGSPTLASIASASSSALAGLASKIDKDATTIAGTSFQMQTSGYAGGNGLAIYDGGMIFKYGGTAKFTFNSSTGALSVIGDISGSSGNFAGNVNTNGFVTALGRGDSSYNYAAVAGVANSSGDAAAHFDGGSNGWGVYAISSRTNYPTIRARHTLTGSGTGYAIHADTNSDSGAAVYAQVNAGSGLAILTSGPSRFGGALDVQSSLQCDSLRIDQTPSTGSATATFPGNNKPGGNTTCSWLSVNLNGTTYYIPAWT